MNHRLRAALLGFGALPLLTLIPSSASVVGGLADGLGAVMGLACQDNPSRALSPLGQPMSVCARCTGLYLGLFGSALLLRPGFRRPALWLWLSVGLTAVFLDVATEWLRMRPPSAALRVATGMMASYPAGLLALGIGRSITKGRRLLDFDRYRGGSAFLRG